MTNPRRVVVAMSGASGAIYGIRMLEVLAADPSIETHAIISRGAAATIAYETDRSLEAVTALADVAYEESNLAAALASGTFLTYGMVVAPCSIRTLSSIANSNNDNLITRAADVHLKERRRLVLMVRETPLHLGHLRLMVQAAEIGAIIFPPVPAFYAHPATLEEMVDQTVGRMLARLGIANDLYIPWSG